MIHGVCGFFGVINVGIFGGGSQKYSNVVNNRSELQENGVDMNKSVFNVLAIQFLGAISLAVWAGLISYIFFKTLSNMGQLRVGQFYEIVGIDILTHTMSDLIGMNDNFLRDSKKYMSLKKDAAGIQLIELDEAEGF
jgi:ammonia channel protein AmtB